MEQVTQNLLIGALNALRTNGKAAKESGKKWIQFKALLPVRVALAEGNPNKVKDPDSTTMVYISSNTNIRVFGDTQYPKAEITGMIKKGGDVFLFDTASKQKSYNLAARVKRIVERTDINEEQAKQIVDELNDALDKEGLK